LANTNPRSFSYAVLRYLTDVDREITVPIGIALCDADSKEITYRFPKSGERIVGVTETASTPFLDLLKSKLDYWLEGNPLPYANPSPEPFSQAWWDHVRKLMQFRVRIGKVESIACVRPEEEIETLYEAVVKPHVSSHKQAARVSRAVTDALGPRLARRLTYGKPVLGYRNREINVLRHVADARRLVVVEAVNLAATTAETETYALDSKLRSIIQQAEESNITPSIVLGYLASPKGLNGEGTLKDWLEHDLNIKLYDLTRERQEFHDSVQDKVAHVNADLDVVPARRNASATFPP
jgi:hypothetical protein